MRKKAIIFYAGLVYGEYENERDLVNAMGCLDGGYAYIQWYGAPSWYTSDLKRVAVQDVPKEYQMMVLLMT